MYAGDGSIVNRAIPPSPQSPPPHPPPPLPQPLPPLALFGTQCKPGSFEYSLGAAPPSGEGYVTTSNLQAVLPAVYVNMPVSFSGNGFISQNGYQYYGYIVINLPSGSVSVCTGYYYGYCYYGSTTIGNTFTEVSLGVFTANDGDLSCYTYPVGYSAYSSTIPVSCGASAALTSAVLNGCIWDVAVTSPAVCPPPIPVSITLCAGTTVANAALVVAPTSVVSIGCTRVTTPPSCVLDGGRTSQIMSVGTSAIVSLSGLALQNGKSVDSASFVPDSPLPPGFSGGGALFIDAYASVSALLCLCQRHGDSDGRAVLAPAGALQICHFSVA